MNQSDFVSDRDVLTTPQGLVTGRIVRGNAGLYDVIGQDGVIYSCRARGSFRHDRITPLVGDRVTVLSGEDGTCRIEQILPRKNELIRPPFANLDVLFLVLAAKDPAPSLLYADKLLAIAEYQKIEPAVVINKCGKAPQEAEKIGEIYRKAGYPVFLTDMKSGMGRDELLSFILSQKEEKVAAFSGPSGVGKSTIMNALFGTLQRQTGELSEKTARGKHTTRLVELYRLSDLMGTDTPGYLADTPGFSMIDFDRFDFFRLSDLPETFREFRPHLSGCRYTKCTHTKEEGCAVLDAVRRGEIAPSRHESFLDLYASLKEKPSWKN